MSEPDFLMQNGEGLEGAAAKEWYTAAAKEMSDNGAKFYQISYHPTVIPKTWLVEGWKERPDSYGEPRWQFAAYEEGK